VTILIVFFIVHWYASLFSQTFFLHRYSAHGMFIMNKFWEKFFYAFLYLTQGSSYLQPRAYAVLHRMHHMYSDTEKDPHSPHYSSNIFTMMWKTKAIYSGVAKNTLTVEDKFLKNLPEWKFIDNIGDSWPSRLIWGVIYSLIYIHFNTPEFGGGYWWLYLLLPIHFLMGPVHGAIVNWFGHKLGYQNFDNHDQSKNTLVVDVLLGGELYQNNHHKYAARPNFAAKWYEIDISWPVIKTLDLIGIIKLNYKPDSTPF
jgi:stearoyl-CoA desaturase (delta-9 desaturase)